MKKLSIYNFNCKFLALLSFDFISQKSYLEKKSKSYTKIKKRSENIIKPILYLS